MVDEPTLEPVASAPEPVTPSESVRETPAPAETPSPAPTAEQPATETPTAQIPANEPLPPTPTPAAASAPVPTQPARDLLVKARATIQDRKRKKLDKILEALATKEKITNDEVEKLLHVSDATATRYLSALEKEGKIQQVGRTGKAVEYTRI